MSGASMDTPSDGTKVAVETTIGFLEGGVQRVDLATEAGLVVFRLTVAQAGQGTVTASYADGSAMVALTVHSDGHFTAA
jgi:hypothetical protein